MTLAMATPVEWVNAPGGDVMMPMVCALAVPATVRASVNEAKKLIHLIIVSSFPS
jgi:hypothetical protein